MSKVIACVLLALALAGATRIHASEPPVHVVLWFDTEDYILPQDDDATKRLAEMLTRLGIRATFKIVGEKARVLEQRGRTDVIAALKLHEIGYHSDTHSQQPTIAVYLQNAGWEDGAAEFYRREIPGVGDITRIFGVAPTCYGQPGSAWAPQAYPALQRMGIGVYLDEADHVGLDDQPFYYDGMLNVFRMRSTLARMELKGGDSLAEGEIQFTREYDTLQRRGGGTISIYYHPSEWVHAEFWDAVNFSHGANPPRAAWKKPATRPPAETERAFSDFDTYLQFIKSQPGVDFVTPTDLRRLYADGAMTRGFSPEDLLGIAKLAQDEVTFRRFDGYAISAADAFVLLTDAVASFVEQHTLAATTSLSPIDGPARAFNPSVGGTRSAVFTWAAFGTAVRDTADYCRMHGRMPDEIWIGAENLSPADYLATLAGAAERVLAAGTPPAEVARRSGRFTSDRYVAEDSEKLWSWPIFPDGFHAPRLMDLARLQAWTLKPAILRAPPPR